MDGSLSSTESGMSTRVSNVTASSTFKSSFRIYFPFLAYCDFVVRRALSHVKVPPCTMMLLGSNADNSCTRSQQCYAFQRMSGSNIQAQLLRLGIKYCLGQYLEPPQLQNSHDSHCGQSCCCPGNSNYSDRHMPWLRHAFTEYISYCSETGK